MTSPHPKPRLSAIPALLFAVGLGMAFHFGHAWYRLPTYSAEDIELSIDMNAALADRHRGKSPKTPTGTRREALRQALVAAITAERRSAQRYTAVGLLMALAALAQMFVLRRLAARTL